MIPTIDLTDTKLTGKGKYIISDGATSEPHDNYLIDINIEINLNLGKKINPETLEQCENLLNKILKVKGDIIKK